MAVYKNTIDYLDSLVFAANNKNSMGLLAVLADYDLTGDVYLTTSNVWDSWSSHGRCYDGSYVYAIKINFSKQTEISQIFDASQLKICQDDEICYLQYFGKHKIKNKILYHGFEISTKNGIMNTFHFSKVNSTFDISSIKQFKKKTIKNEETQQSN